MSKQHTERISLGGWLKENRHAYWSACLILIILCYIIPERLVTADYWSTEIAFDNQIPFLPGFVYFYILWFPMLVGTGLWLLHKDGRGFQRYMLFLSISYFACAVIYVAFPNGQDLRPDGMEVNSLSTWILSLLYGVDTNTNVLPSLHVVASVGVACTVYTSPAIPSRIIRIGTVILAILASASTVFVKQHAILDVFAGLVAGIVFYGLTCLLCRRKKQNSAGGETAD